MQGTSLLPSGCVKFRCRRSVGWLLEWGHRRGIVKGATRMAIVDLLRQESLERHRGRRRSRQGGSMRLRSSHPLITLVPSKAQRTREKSTRESGIVARHRGIRGKGRLDSSS